VLGPKPAVALQNAFSPTALNPTDAIVMKKAL
jgi:hypothetical protein